MTADREADEPNPARCYVCSALATHRIPLLNGTPKVMLVCDAHGPMLREHFVRRFLGASSPN